MRFSTFSDGICLAHNASRECIKPLIKQIGIKYNTYTNWVHSLGTEHENIDYIFYHDA